MAKAPKKVSLNSNIRTLCGPQFCLAIVDLICQNISHRPFFSGSVVLVEEKGCNGAWVGITNWMTTPIWSHSLHRPLSDGGGGRPSVQSPLKNSIPPSFPDMIEHIVCRGKLYKELGFGLLYFSHRYLSVCSLLFVCFHQYLLRLLLLLVSFAAFYASLSSRFLWSLGSIVIISN